MRVVGVVACMYVLVMLPLVGLLQYLASHDRHMVFTAPSPGGTYVLRAYFTDVLPFGLSGRRRCPGEVALFDRGNHELDSTPIAICGNTSVRWTNDKVYVRYQDSGRLRETSLDLPQ